MHHFCFFYFWPCVNAQVSVCTPACIWECAYWRLSVFSARPADSWTIHPALIEFTYTLCRSGARKCNRKENTLHTIICFSVSPPDTVNIEAEIMLTLEKLFCPRQAPGLTDEDEPFECLSASVVKLWRGSDTDGHVCVGEEKLEQSRRTEGGRNKTICCRNQMVCG